MQARVLDEAATVAAARWEATRPTDELRRRALSARLRPFDEVAARRWAETSPDHERPGGDLQAQLAADGWWLASTRPPTYRLFDAHDQPITCHLCGHDDAWMPEGDGEQRIVRVFLCLHEPVQVGSGTVRQVSMIALKQVTRCEATAARQ